jgi:hypothetical protein
VRDSPPSVSEPDDRPADDGSTPEAQVGQSPPLGARQKLSTLIVTWDARFRRLAPTPRFAWPLGLLFLAGVVWFHLPSLKQELVELHSFRQTQTAWTALIFHQQGIDLFHAKLPVLGPPWELPFEFPLFQALASLVMDVGVPADPAMRITGLAMFVLTALAVWRLVARLAGETAGLVSLVAFATSGLALLWSRTSLIEYMVTAAAVGGLYFLVRWHERANWAWWALALGAGIVAMLVKPTTAVMYLPAIAALGWSAWRDKEHRPFGSTWRYGAALAAVIVIPLAFGYLWTAYADAIKAASPFTAGETSAALWTWNYGTIPQRFSPDTWNLIGGRIDELVLGGAPLIWTVLAFVGCFWIRRRAFALAWLAGAFIGPLLFINLYWVHDYYLIALSPMAAAGVAFGLRWLLVEWRWVLPPLLGLVLVVAWGMTIQRSQHYWGIQFWQTGGGERHLEAAQYIDARSNPGDIVVVTGRGGWIPATLYYAQRWGLMVGGDPDDSLVRALGPLLPQLRATGYTRLFHCPPYTACVAAYDLTTDPPRLLP